MGLPEQGLSQVAGPPGAGCLRTLRNGADTERQKNYVLKNGKIELQRLDRVDLHGGQTLVRDPASIFVQIFV